MAEARMADTVRNMAYLEGEPGGPDAREYDESVEEPSGHRSVAAALDERLDLFRSIPQFFLGLGIYRAWIEIAFVASFVDFPTHAYASHDAFDLFMIAALFLGAALAKRIAPLVCKRGVKLACAVLLIVPTCMEFYCVWHPELAESLAWPSAVLGGIGIAIMILMWSEVYATLSPVRICLYYSVSLVVGAAIIWVYRGFVMEWLPAMVCLLPLVSLICLGACLRGMPEDARPQANWAKFSFPWKPVVLVMVYAFVFGLQEANAYMVTGPHSAPGLVVCCLVVIVGIMILGDAVEFGTIYSVWLPFAAAAFLVVGAVASLSPSWTSFCANFGYAASEIFVMTMIGSICYHYGVSALWLFGIERGVRAIAMLSGRFVAQHSPLYQNGGLVVLVLVAVLVATFMILSEKRVNAMWGVQLRDKTPQEEADGKPAGVAHRNAVVTRCSDLSRMYKLSQREEEVLLLLAQHKSATDIEHELYVANGTAKAHIRHVYQKLDIHSREELFELVEGNRGV